jgi:hypothetical protein
MLTPRTTLIATLAVASTLAAAATAVVPAAGGPVPVVKLTGTISPANGKLKAGTPLTVRIDARFSSVPPGGDFVLQSHDYLFPRGASVNGKLFPSCKVSTLKAAHGNLGACPKGSKIGTGVATGIAVAIGVKSHGNITLFNGPGGKSITLNIDIEHPAVINETWSASLQKTSGKYALKLSESIPDTLKTIIGGDVVVTSIDVTTFATRVVNGRKRGYVEAVNCPKSGKAPFHADFIFNQGARASADSTIAC